MYAAAGGASLASRQARQKQRQNKKAQQLKNQKASDLLPKPPQSKQYHNYTDQLVPRLSRVERNALKPPTSHERRHSTSNYHLKEPSKARIRESPSICIPVQNHLNQAQQPSQPLTPCTLVQNHLTIPPSPSLQSQLPQIFIPEGDTGLERRCSFVRQVEEMGKHQQTGVLDRCNHICNFEIKDKGWDNNPAFFAEYDKSAFGSLDYPFSECSQGRAAWQERERGRRCSLSEEARQHRLKQTEAHHRWMKRNRIHDTSYGGSSDDEDFFNVYHQSAAANALLYVGLGTTAIGSVIFFVGTGEKGFKTLELRLIGPTLIACGLLCCLIRVLLCACPSTCIRRRKKTRLKNVCPHGSYPRIRDKKSDFVPLERTCTKKKVSIAPGGGNPMPSTSTSNFQEPEDAPLKPSIPIITVPEFADFNADDETCRLKRDDSLIELQNLDMHYELQSVSSCDSDTVVEIESRRVSKHVRTREPAFNLAVEPAATDTLDIDLEDVETCLSVVVERSDNYSGASGDKADKSDKSAKTATDRRDSNRGETEKSSHSGIVLSPLQLGQ